MRHCFECEMQGEPLQRELDTVLLVLPNCRRVAAAAAHTPGWRRHGPLRLPANQPVLSARWGVISLRHAATPSKPDFQCNTVIEPQNQHRDDGGQCPHGGRHRARRVQHIPDPDAVWSNRQSACLSRESSLFFFLSFVFPRWWLVAWVSEREEDGMTYVLYSWLAHSLN